MWSKNEKKYIYQFFSSTPFCATLVRQNSAYDPFSAKNWSNSSLSISPLHQLTQKYSHNSNDTEFVQNIDTNPRQSFQVRGLPCPRPSQKVSIFYGSEEAQNYVYDLIDLISKYSGLNREAMKVEHPAFKKFVSSNFCVPNDAWSVAIFLSKLYQFRMMGIPSLIFIR